MGKNRWRTAVLFAIVAAVVLQASGQTKRAVVIGINTYLPQGARLPEVSSSGVLIKPGGKIPADSAKGRGTWSNLRGSVNDAEAMIALLPRFGFKPENIHLLCDRTSMDSGDHKLCEAEATREGILTAIRKYLIDPSREGDVAFFYYAGHGSQMKNSKGRERDGYDESIVPADSIKGALDIRDKEFSRLFNQVVDRKAALTAIYDSCHSGSIARGVTLRTEPPLEIDAADPGEPLLDETGKPVIDGKTGEPKLREPPEQRGALVISAAQDVEGAAEREDDQGNPHGVFTTALLQVLRTTAVNAPAIAVFDEAVAKMHYDRASQEPVLAATPQRKELSLFGSEAGALAGKILLVVRNDRTEDGLIELSGGLVLGLGEGSEVVSADGDGGKALRLRIVRQSVAESFAEPATPSSMRPRVGAIFYVDRAVPPAKTAISVWVPDANIPSDQFALLEQSLRDWRSTPGVQWVDDPVHARGAQMVFREGASWVMESANGAKRNLGAKPDFRAFANERGDHSVFVNVPLHRDRILKALASSRAAIRVVSSPADADYVLVGRRQTGEAARGKSDPSGSCSDDSTRRGSAGLEYAWVSSRSLYPVQQRGTGTENAHESTLPGETRWVPLPAGGNIDGVFAQLGAMAEKLAKTAAWMNLESSTGHDDFPYRLAIVRARDKKTFGDGETLLGTNREDDDAYGLALVADKGAASRTIPKRYVYVFILDSSGARHVLFPDLSAGSVENRFPAPDTHDLAFIPLGDEKSFQISCPFGTDTYFMLATEKPIDASVLESEGVRDASRGASPTGLEALLNDVGSTRGAKRSVPAPADWSIERLVITSAYRTTEQAK